MNKNNASKLWKIIQEEKARQIWKLIQEAGDYLMC
jgi:hypothetical protein